MRSWSRELEEISKDGLQNVAVDKASTGTMGQNTGVDRVDPQRSEFFGGEDILQLIADLPEKGALLMDS